MIEDGRIDQLKAMRRRRTLEACINCGRPVSPSGGRSGAKGRCHTCYDYWHSSGKTKERPSHLFAAA